MFKKYTILIFSYDFETRHDSIDTILKNGRLLLVNFSFNLHHNNLINSTPTGGVILSVVGE